VRILHAAVMQASQDEGRYEQEDAGPGLDDYEPVPDDNPEAQPAHSQGYTEDAMTENAEEEEGEDLFGDNYIRCNHCRMIP
jgi:hypothetical protein